VGARPSAIAYYDGSLWVANLDESTVSRVDPQQQRVVHNVTTGTAPTAIAAGDGAVWAIGSDGFLRRIDPGFNAVSRQIRIYTPCSRLTSGSTAAGVAVRKGSVWTATGSFFSSPRVTRVDATKDKIARTFATGRSPAAIAAGFGALWVADNFENTVSRLDPSGIVTTTPVGHEPQAIAVGDGAVWVVDTGDNEVVRINPATRSPRTTIPVGARPSAIAVGANAVWVANSRDGTVSRIDPAKNVVVKTIHVGNSPAGRRRCRIRVGDEPAGSKACPRGGPRGCRPLRHGGGSGDRSCSLSRPTDQLRDVRQAPQLSGQTCSGGDAADPRSCTIATDAIRRRPHIHVHDPSRFRLLATA